MKNNITSETIGANLKKAYNGVDTLEWTDSVQHDICKHMVEVLEPMKLVLDRLDAIDKLDNGAWVEALNGWIEEAPYKHPFIRHGVLLESVVVAFDGIPAVDDPALLTHLDIKGWTVSQFDAAVSAGVDAGWVGSDGTLSIPA